MVKANFEKIGYGQVEPNRMNLAEYGVSGDGRLYLDLTKAIEVLEQNKLFVGKFDVNDFCQEELEGFGGFLMSILRNPRKFIQNLSK